MDVETTGLSAIKNDMVQLAMIIEVDGKQVAEQKFHMQPFDYNAVDDKALLINNLKLEDIKKFPKPQETFEEVKKFLSKYVNKYEKMDKYHPAGYNVNFDTEFIKHFFKKNGDTYYGSWFNYRAVDPMHILHTLDARGTLKLPDYKLVSVCKHFGIPLEDAHDALCDIRATKALAEFLGYCLAVDLDKLEGGYEQFCKRRG